VLIPEIKSCTDNLYNKANNAGYHYYLFIHSHAFYSVIADKLGNKILNFTAYELAAGINIFALNYDLLKTLKQITDESAQPFKSRSVIICNNTAALIPETLLNIVEIEKIYALNRMVEPNTQVMYCKMHYKHIACMFNVNNELLKLIRFSMPMVDVYHSALLFIKAADRQGLENASKNLHVQLHHQFIEIACVNGGLKYYNTFNFNTDTDIVYYILAAAEHLQIDGDAVVYLYGNSNQAESLVPLLKNYVGSVLPGKKPLNFCFPDSLSLLAEKFYFTELSALLCE